MGNCCDFDWMRSPCQSGATVEEITNLIQPKADKTYVDSQDSAILTELRAEESARVEADTNLAKAHNYVTPEEYGAVGDGETDDSIAIKQAIASGKTVVGDSRKTYKVTQITDVENVELYGLNIVVDDGYTLFSIDTNYKFVKCNFYGNKLVYVDSTTYSKNVDISECSFNMNYCLRLAGFNNVKVSNNNFYTTYIDNDHCSWFISAKMALVSGNNVTGGTNNLYECRNAIVNSNNFYNVYRGATIGGQETTYAICSNNSVYKAISHGVTIDLATNDGYADGYALCSNNIINDCVNGIYLQGDNISVIGNKVNNATAYGIRLNTNDTNYTCSIFNNSVNVTGSSVPIYIASGATVNYSFNDVSGEVPYEISGSDGTYYEVDKIQTFNSGTVQMYANKRKIVATESESDVTLRLPRNNQPTFVGMTWDVINNSGHNLWFSNADSGIISGNVASSMKISSGTYAKVTCIGKNTFNIISIS